MRYNYRKETKGEERNANAYVHTTLYTHLLRFKQSQCYQLLSDPTLQHVHMGHREIHLTRRRSCPLTSQRILQECPQKNEKLRYLSHNLVSHSIYHNELLGEGSVLGFLFVLRFRLLQKSVRKKVEERNGKEVEERNGKDVVEEERNGKEEMEEER